MENCGVVWRVLRMDFVVGAARTVLARARVKRLREEVDMMAC